MSEFEATGGETSFVEVTKVETKAVPAPTAIPAVEVTNIHHRYKDHHALKGVNFQVPAGALHGFVGPNGAGKTTCLKLICTLLKPQYGQVKVFGHDVARDTKAVRRTIGFMPDHFSMYRQMTVHEYLDFFGAAYGLRVKERDTVIKDVLELTDMAVKQSTLINGLSRGMQQRVSLARVLINDPKLLLLDEPASGLDPRARIELMDILRALQSMGKTIFISSHILSELAELCDSVTIIDRGTVKFSGAMDDLLERGRSEDVYVVTITGASEDVVAGLESLVAVSSVEPVQEGRSQYRVSLSAEVLLNQLLAELGSTELNVKSLVPERKQLNQAFMDLTQGGVA